MADVTSPFGFPYPEDTDLVRDGATDIESLATGVNDYLTGGYLYAGTEYYTSSGTFAKADPLGTGDIGLRAIRVRMVGGGGGGGGAEATGSNEVSNASGGGSGGYSESFITDIAGLDASVTVTRGAGGAGGSAAVGVAGGQSSFGASVTADGGPQGNYRAATTPPTNIVPFDNVAAGTGDFASGGSTGHQGVGPGAAFSLGGAGGSSVFGGGGRGGTANGTAAVGAGSGGGGAANPQNTAVNRTGGAGANGIVIIDCFV
jgi:hypothetical protein